MLRRVGHSKDVATGRLQAFDVLGHKVAVANADGHLYAFEDTCTHTGCSLASRSCAASEGYPEREPDAPRVVQQYPYIT